MEGLQSHANFHFTFALVEMPVYKREDPASGGEELLVTPRTLLKTRMVERLIVRVEGKGVSLEDVSSTSKRTPRNIGITEEQFWESIEADFGSESRKHVREIRRVIERFRR